MCPQCSASFETPWHGNKVQLGRSDVNASPIRGCAQTMPAETPHIIVHMPRGYTTLPERIRNVLLWARQCPSRHIMSSAYELSRLRNAARIRLIH